MSSWIRRSPARCAGLTSVMPVPGMLLSGAEGCARRAYRQQVWWWNCPEGIPFVNRVHRARDAPRQAIKPGTGYRRADVTGCARRACRQRVGRCDCPEGISFVNRAHRARDAPQQTIKPGTGYLCMVCQSHHSLRHRSRSIYDPATFG